MMKRYLVAIVVLAALLCYAGEAPACPACKDQVPSQKTADGKMLVDPMGTQRGFALSIYVLLSAVYGLPCMLGFMLWRSVRAVQARKRRLRSSSGNPAAPGPAEGLHVHLGEHGLPATNWGPAREEAGS